MISPDNANDECYYDAECAIYNEIDMDDGSGGRGDPEDSDQQQVYFELEDGANNDEEEGIRREDKYKTALLSVKGKTIKSAKVNVLQQIKLFEKDGKSGTDKKKESNFQSRQDPIASNKSRPVNHEKDDDQDDGMVYEVATRVHPVENRERKQDAAECEYNLASAVAVENAETEYMLAGDVGVDNNENEYLLATDVQVENANSEYMLASAVKSSGSRTGSLGTVKSTNIGCQEGTGAAVPVDFIHPVAVPADGRNSSEYSRLYFQSTAAEISESERKDLAARGYSTLGSIQTVISKSDGSDAEVSDDDNSFDWGSEFDETSYQDCEDDLYESDSQKVGYTDDLPEKPLPRKPLKIKPYQALIPRPLRSPCNRDELAEVDLASSAVCLPVNIDPSKHPPPSLPTPPDGLTDEQRKRRCVVDLIISSEKSYVESLERIIKQYETPVLGGITEPRPSARILFSVVREIISYHKMFSIELAECVSKWDEEEKIGDIFTASFSKTMVFNAYSAYVNNFSATMEEIKSAQRHKQAFDDFLKEREKSNADRLSLFGLMVKPVQRFPQFIMCLQDLIKYMPQNHHDRRALQLALTELENVTHMLNEGKRRSEQRFQALQTIRQLTRQKPKHMLTAFNLDTNSRRSLIRYDTVDEVSGEFGQMKCKNRRLILMNDLVLCVKVIEKEQGGFPVERLGLRWKAKLKDLELKDTAITPDMESVISKDPGRIHIISSQLDNSENDPFHLYADLSEMLHDFTVLGQISGLASTLKRSYAGHGLKEELIHEISRDLQCMIQLKDEQLRLVNSCSIVLVDNSSSAHYVLQTQTASIKQDWCVDFLMAKMALNKHNCCAWDAPHASDDQQFDPLPAIFMKHMSVDVPRNYTKNKKRSREQIRCAVSVYLSPEKSPHGVGVQHLWVCSSSPTRGQVSILSIHNSKPSLTESFSACNCEILCVELVPGCGDETKPGRYLFVEDTVWMANTQRQILVFPLSGLDGVRRDPLTVIDCHTKTVSIYFVDERIFCGHENGTMDILSRDSDGAWAVNRPTTLMFGVSLVQSHFVWEEDLWVSCGNKMYVVEIDSMQSKTMHELQADQMSSIGQVVRSGMGIWVSFHNSAIIRLFHLETMENLQEISIGNFLQRISTDKIRCLSSMVDSVVVTTLASSKGLLWIGTSQGVVLTVPLPRLSDGVPLYRGRPSVSLHAHRGPVKFLLPLMYASNTLELNRSSSLRSTLRSRPSRRNAERERIELLESEKRSEKPFSPPTESIVSSDMGKGSKSASLSSNYKAVTLNVPDRKDEDSTKGKGKKDKGIKKLLMKKKSFDDTDIVMRRKGKHSVSEQRRKSQTLSFRSELANRIVVQSERLSSSSLDLTLEDHLEVEMLYENLLEENVDVAFDRSLKSRRTIESMPSRPSKSNTMPSLNNSESHLPTEGTKLSPSPSTTSQSSADSGSSTKGTVQTSDSISSRAITRNSTLRTGTMRKGTSCNAVIVLSGGDGYQDLDETRTQSGGDDACVLLWIYKF